MPEPLPLVRTPPSGRTYIEPPSNEFVSSDKDEVILVYQFKDLNMPELVFMFQHINTNGTQFLSLPPQYTNRSGSLSVEQLTSGDIIFNLYSWYRNKTFSFKCSFSELACKNFANKRWRLGVAERIPNSNIFLGVSGKPLEFTSWKEGAKSISFDQKSLKMGDFPRKRPFE